MSVLIAELLHCLYFSNNRLNKSVAGTVGYLLITSRLTIAPDLANPEKRLLKKIYRPQKQILLDPNPPQAYSTPIN